MIKTEIIVHLINTLMSVVRKLNIIIVIILKANAMCITETTRGRKKKIKI